MYYKEDEEEISVRSVFGAFLIGWKLILILAIVFAISGVGFAKHKNKQIEVSIQSLDVSQEEKIERVRKQLLPTQVKKIDSLYAQYLTYLKVRDNLSDVMSSSVLMKLGADEVVSKVIEYTIDTNQSDIGSALSSLALTDELYERVADLYGDDVNADDLAGIIQIQNENSSDATGDDINVRVENRFYTILSVQILAESKKQADKIGFLVDNGIQAAVSGFTSVDPDITIQKLGEEYMADASSILVDQQRSNVNNLNTVFNQVNTLETGTIASLQGDEKAYYDLLSSQVNEEAAEEDTTVVADEMVSVKKYGVVGLAVGIVLALVVLAIRFATSSKIPDVDTITGAYMIPVLTSLTGGRKNSHDPLVKKGIAMQRQADTQHTISEQIYALTAELQHAIDEKNLESITLLGNLRNTEIDRQATAVAHNLRCDKIGKNDPLSSDANLTEILSSDATVIFVELGVTTKKELRQIVDIMDRNRQTVLGIVVIH